MDWTWTYSSLLLRSQQPYRMRLTEHIWLQATSHCFIASQPDSR